MGTNKRYAASIDRRVTMRGQPLSLGDDELELDEYPLTRTRKLLPAIAWVRYPLGPVRVAASVVAWTDRAVAIQWKTPSGDEHKAWVWKSAVSEPKPGQVVRLYE